jgi:exopolysaccharide production protein ExoY
MGSIGRLVATLLVTHHSSPADRRHWRWVDYCERIASAVLLTAGSPILAASAATVSLLSGRAPLIAHRRVGWRGSTLWMLKLRTMWNPEERGPRRGGWIEYIDDETGPQCKSLSDPRVPNWFCRFCRRHSIDEIPQLWHVLRGEMALVGPRPLTRSELRLHYGPDSAELLEVKPGLAGLWQVSGRSRLTYPQRRKLDLQFVRHASVGMYIQILVKAVMEVFRGSNSW